MKCESCGYELEEDKLYCPKCGYEIHMVPDFDPEIEEKITGALEGITNHLIESEKKEEKEAQREKKEKQEIKISFISTMIAVIFIIMLAVGLLLSNHMGTMEARVDRARKAASEKNYTKAIENMLKAVEMDNSNMELKYALGEYYLLDGQTSKAIAVFQEIIAADGENEEAYRGLIGIYEKAEDYEAVNQLVLSSHSDKIINTFTKYIANPPEFNYEQGTYDTILRLKLSANTSGKVYYTLDGSEPDERSQVYTNPIVLDDGICTVRAFFINDYGIRSETAVQIYQIHLNKAHEPEISLDSGNYTQPQMITVTVPKGESVYYTIDGSVPTMDSISYNNPIALPMGDSTYCFISYNEDGVASGVVQRQYKFDFQAVLDLPSAVNLLIVGLMQKGIITDINCSVPDRNGRNLYVCSSAISINQRSYYLMVEYYKDLTGVDTRTGNMYCVDAENGALFKAAVDKDGYYSVVSF